MYDGRHIFSILFMLCLTGVPCGALWLWLNKKGKQWGAPGFWRELAATLIAGTVFFGTFFLWPGPQIGEWLMGRTAQAGPNWVFPEGTAWEQLFARPARRTSALPASGLPAAATAEAEAELAAEPTPGPKAKCKQLEPVSHKPTRGQQWHLQVPENEWWVVEVWSNHHDPNLDSHKLLLEPGESATFMSGGGKTWPYSCASLAKANYRDKEMPPIDQTGYDEYIAAP